MIIMAMFRLSSIALSLGLILATATADAQGTSTFQNLNFESANLSGYSPGAIVPFSAAFPGWSGFIGTSQTDRALYDTIAIGGGAISIMDPSAGYAPLQGNY